MAANVTEQTVHALEIVREEEIAAPIDVVFETILEQMGPYNETPDTEPMPMKLEPWPGGRWFRDLGNGAGHFWGNVQAIRRPTLLEICGPLFMSYPAISNVQYRLAEENGVTKMRFVHRAMGLIAPDVRVAEGWGSLLQRIREGAERRGVPSQK
ncbi:SRPBCC family protein [Edaphobacter bradus]|uniref:SRPBCC family protein n=1 Tax=Edaphobacter bradus TaxID=2259016 RepID=UPI0021DF8FD3|nr:SRPBCC domain-containing protein [Edaphobacter bradus]